MKRNEETKSYFDRFSYLKLKPMILGRTALFVSRVGFGGYRVHNRSSEHRSSLLNAIQSGCNVIDTSTNYTDGRSQELIGECIQSEKIDRTHLVIVSKAGYVQGKSLDEFKRYERLNHADIFPDIVKYDEDCWHCLHPDFLKSEIDRSLQRLKMDFIDVMLLHNPEYYLMKHPDSVDEYYRRIQMALTYLETEVERGRIHWIGISSNTFVESENHPHFTSLERIFNHHEAQHKNHHFAIIQLPFNLWEQGGLRASRKSGYTTLEFAKQNKIGVLVNRPLNAIREANLVRLSDIPKVSVLQKFEDIYSDSKALEDHADEKSQLPMVELQKIIKSEFLIKASEQIPNYFSFRDYVLHQFLPYWEHSCKQVIQKFPRSELWMDAYKKSIWDLANGLILQKQNVASEQIVVIKNRMDERAVSLQTSKSISQKLLRTYLGQSGIHVVLVGMRKEEYVKDVLECEAPIDLASSDAVLNLFP